MTINELTENDYDVMVQALRLLQNQVDNYRTYPSYEFRVQRLAEVQGVLDKVRLLRRRANSPEVS